MGESHLVLDIKASAYSFCMRSVEVLDCLVKGASRANDWVIFGYTEPDY